ncbi:pyridoxal phosphate-dependent decarboxylase family protein [Knoellia koreensis]|uniref:Aspartate aminotransferase family protein n=1 Tax=Knoellia koreensis TaxID=2730921 RepID=A0A849HL38_9MICO|nr:aminotransferase class V-fold PLP-dependent enzyme [Knoellia sp. DB2414S]NNM47264.1 aspartate aminotransferase family protein [Knoellia sp. DB2414S]
MGLPADEVRARLEAMAAHDVPTHGGRTLAYVYDSGLAEVDVLARDALAAYASSNGLDPTAFPSLLAMEQDLVRFAGRLLDAPEGFVGTATSGGTESILLAVQAARDARPDIERPRMVLPTTAHAAFHKAAHYFGVEPVLVDVDPVSFRADPAAMAAAIDDRTVLVVASAPSYAHGVVDDVTPIAAAAATAGVRCHVDACIGGWVLPYLRSAGADVPRWTFAVEGVTSISVDLHKYAYTPKGISLLLHRDADLRRPQFFASAQWPGYTMLNSTTQSTKSGGPLAAAWAVVTHLGDDGYAALAATVAAGVRDLIEGVAAIPQLSVAGEPDSALVALRADATLDLFTLADELLARGWYAQPQLSFRDQPPTLHLSLSAATAPLVPDFLAALRESVEVAVEDGPVEVPPELVAAVASIDPETLDDAAFEGLLHVAGLAGADGALALPERMAPVNALLDVAPPRLREALLVAFLDRLTRP